METNYRLALAVGRNTLIAAMVERRLRSMTYMWSEYVHRMTIIDPHLRNFVMSASSEPTILTEMLASLHNSGLRGPQNALEVFHCLNLIQRMAVTQIMINEEMKLFDRLDDLPTEM